MSGDIPHRESVYVLLPAAGGGTRMGAGRNKLLLPIGGVPVIIRTLRIFLAHPSVRMVRIVTAPDDRDLFRSLCSDYGVTERITFADGGDTRQDSVRNGLEHLAGVAQDSDLVLIQDGARCFTDFPTIDRCIAQARKSGACCAAVRLKDTIKEAGDDGAVVATPDRTRFWLIQTPQAFRFDLILDAYRQAHQKGVIGTDDASLAEAAGHPVTLVAGSYLNIKITTPEDLLFGEAIAGGLAADADSSL